MNPVYASIIRHLLTALGAAAVGHGYVNESQLTEIVGALVSLIGMIWGPLDEYFAKRKEDRLRTP